MARNELAILTDYDRDSARALMRSMVDEDLARNYGVSVKTVFKWESVLLVKCRRRCKGCGESFDHKDMALTKQGNPHFGRCQACVKELPKPHPSSAAARSESEYEEVAKLPKLKIGATPGPLLCRYVQGRALMEDSDV